MPRFGFINARMNHSDKEQPIKVGKSQKVFSIWPHPQQNEPNH